MFIIAKAVSFIKSFVKGLFTAEECFHLNDGEYKIMKPAFSKKNREAEEASVNDFVSLSKMGEKVCVTKSSDGKLYVACGDIDGSTTVVVARPATDEEREVLDSLLTK